MCGLFGYSVKKWQPNIATTMMALAIFNESRGKDAFGWTNGKVIFKDSTEITYKFNEIPFEEELVSAFHTRAGTSGGKTKECAHPWQVKGVIGMQNGYVSNMKDLNEKYKRNCRVDSEHLVYHRAEGRGFEDLQFGGVFLWFEDGVGPFFVRNYHRCLEVARLPHDLGIVWSSEWGHLRRALNMSGLGYKTIFQVADVNIVHQLSNEGLMITKEKVEFYEPPIKHTPLIGRLWPNHGIAEEDFHGFGVVNNDTPPHNYVPYQSQEKKLIGPGATQNSYSKEKQEIQSPSTEQTTPLIKRRAEIGVWRDVGAHRIWNPCFHMNRVEVPSTHPITSFSCGCFLNKSYSTAWATDWRIFGEWMATGWRLCTHGSWNKNCKCIPYLKTDNPNQNKKDSKNPNQDTKTAVQGDGSGVTQ